jgi:hypothetical protein
MASEGAAQNKRSRGTLYKTLKKNLYEIISMKVTKQKAGSYAASQIIKDWALWRGRVPPKWLKSLLAYLAKENPEMSDCLPLGIVLPKSLKEKLWMFGDAPESTDTLRATP